MGVGEAFAVEDTAAVLNISNVTEATESYTGTVRLQQGDWSGQFTGQNSLNILAGNANLPIIVGHSKLVRGSGTTRSVATDTIRINTTNQDIRGGSAGRYVRISGGADEAASQGIGIYELATADDILIRRSVSFNLGDRLGDYDRTAGDPMGLWAAVLPANDRLYMSLASTVAASGRYGNTPRPIDLGPTPSALSEGSFGQFTWNNDGGHPVGTTFTHTGGAATFTIAANKKALCVLTYQTDGNADRNSVIVFVRQSDGTSIEGGIVSTYLRNGTSDIMCGSLVFPIFTGGSTMTLDVVFAEQVEETVPEVTIIDASIQLIDLTEADWVMAGHNLAVTDLSGQVFQTADWNQTLQEDVASWSHDPVTNNSRLTNNAGATITALVGSTMFWDRNLATAGARKVPHHQFARNGTRLDYGVFGEYNRGAQSGDDQFISGSSHAIPVELTSAQYVELQYRDLSNTANSNMEINNDQYIGSSIFWAVRIDNLGVTPVTLDWTLDTYLQAELTTTYTSDVYLQTEITDSYTLDSFLQKAIETSYTLDTFFKGTITTDYIIDTFLKGTITTSYTTDTFFQTTPTTTYTLDTILSVVRIETYILDTLLKGEKTATYTLDIFLKDEITTTYQIDTYLQALDLTTTYVIDTLLQEQNKTTTYDLDVYFQIEKPLNYTLDVFLKATLTLNYTIDTFLQKTITLDYILDVILSAGFELTYTLDVYLQAIKTVTYILDAIIVNTFSLVYTLDTYLQIEKSLTYTLDIFIRDTLTTTYSIDVYLQDTITLSYTLDIFVQDTLTTTYTLDILLQIERTDTYSLDVILILERTDNYTLDTFLQKEFTLVYTLDTVLQVTRTDTYTLDIILFSVPTLTYTLDVSLIGGKTQTYLLDTLLQKEKTITYTIGVLLVVAGVGLKGIIKIRNPSDEIRIISRWWNG